MGLLGFDFQEDGKKGPDFQRRMWYDCSMSSSVRKGYLSWDFPEFRSGENLDHILSSIPTHPRVFRPFITGHPSVRQARQS